MKKINKIFSKKNSITLDLYLEKILYDKEFGYYQKKNPFGAKGDFITAPNISNIFCEMILLVNSVRVAAPSSSDNPLTKEISKSLIS